MGRFSFQTLDMLELLIAWTIQFITLPIFIYGILFLKYTSLQMRLQIWLGRGKHARLGPIIRRVNMIDVVEPSTASLLDFVDHRGYAYVHSRWAKMPRHLAKLATGNETTELISDEQLAYVLTSTVCAHSVSWCEEREMYHFNMDGFDRLTLFENFYFDARAVYFSEDLKKLIIVMIDGKEYHNDVTGEERNTYNLVKLHLQVCITFFVVGLAHNHVHFVFPSSIAVLAPQLLHHQGILYKLLAPHFQFTEKINNQALVIGKSFSNRRSLYDRLFNFWLSFPITKEQFSKGVVLNTERYYHGQGGTLPTTTEVMTDSDDGDCCDVKEQRKHNIFPPQFVTDPKLKKLPYMKFIGRYYHEVKKFVQQIEPLIDRDEWKKLAAEVTSQSVPHFDKVDMVTAITTFIHQVGVVHHADHASYLKYFAWRYGCNSIRNSFEPFSNFEYWQEQVEKMKQHSSKLTLEQIKENPVLLLKPQDIFRTRCFFDMFVQFIPNPAMDLTLMKTEYHFGNQVADTAQRNFFTRLRQCDGKLKDTSPPMSVEKGKPEEVRADNLQLIPVEELIRTVCY